MSEEYIDFTKQIEFFKNKITKIKNYKNLEYMILGSIMIFALYIRTLNLKLLQGKYLLGLDPYYYLRQSTEILTFGKLPFPDLMRNAPFGIEKGFDLFPYFLAYFSKFMSIFGFSVVESHILYPSVFMVLSLIPFYLLVKLVFDKKTAFLSALILSFLPAYIFRTMSGFSDHESISMFLIFFAIYFLIKSEKEKTNKKLFYSSAAGLFSFLMAAAWNAYPFLFIIIGSYFLLKIFFSKIDYKNYLVFFISLMVPFSLIKDINLTDLGFLYLIGVTIIIFIDKKFNFEKIINIPNQVSTFGIILILITLFILISDFLSFSEIVNRLLNAGGVSKVDFTTSEAISTKVLGGNGYYSQFNEFIFISFIGFCILLNELFSKLNKKENFILTSLFSISIGLVIFGSWSNSINLMEKNYLFFLFSVFLFFIYYYSTIYRKKNHHNINNLKNPEILMFISYFLISGLLARTAVRFLFLMTPIVAILSAYAIIFILNKLIKNKIYFFGLIIIIVILSLGSINQSINMGKNLGSSYPGQWEQSMNWINENTPEDSIIAHWWDYGYWTQYSGNRATISDGGRAGGDLGIYTLARYGMLGDDEKETLEYFESRNTSYLLYSDDEILKYGAFSYIGSDINEDKKSQIGIYSLKEVKEVRNGNRLIYSGSWRIDSDIIEGNKIINEGNAIVSKISFTISEKGDILDDAKITLASQGFQKEYDLKCIYVDGKIIIKEYSKLDYCVSIIPVILNDKTQAFGGILLQSNKVHNSLFSKLYINDFKMDGYSKVYDDNTPLAIYNGRLIGPIKIWKINYFNSGKNLDRFYNLDKYIDFYPKNGLFEI